jgi:hypothetical protein
MGVVYEPIKEVENVARHNGGERHASPVLAKTVDPESFGHEGRINSEQKAVSKACQSRNKLEIVRVFNADCTELCSRKDQGCDDETPGPTSV